MSPGAESCRHRLPWIGALCCVLLCGCYLSHRPYDDDDVGADGDALWSEPAEADPCNGTRERTQVVVDKVDLLFVVDDSNSMAGEQEALRAQFPRMIRTLVNGERTLPDGSVETFTPVTSLHLGVVSTDMGLPGVSGIANCFGLGDDGILQHRPGAVPGLEGCAATYPRFLEYEKGDDGEALAQDFACIATVGIEGCGFEQQLEAGLKALWPAVDIDPNTGMQWVDPNTGMPGNRITFLGDIEGQGLGHGDGQNEGFLRRGGGADLSVLGVVLVTDEEDCSASSTEHLQPAMFLPDSSPYKTQPINLRCFLNPSLLYSLDRYENGLRALRPGLSDFVIFAAIVGVPPDLARLHDAQGRALVDFQNAAEREAWYDAILDDPRMEQRIDTGIEQVARRTLLPACGDPDEPLSEAHPPPRIVELARRFGPNGIVQSICDDDFTGAMDAILRRVVVRLGPLRCEDDAPM